jgi:hypothetical protein
MFMHARVCVGGGFLLSVQFQINKFTSLNMREEHTCE